MGRQRERLVLAPLLHSDSAPLVWREGGEEGHNGRWTPSKRMFCERWEWRHRWREGCGVSGDRFASTDSPIHLSLTLTPGARGEQSACGQDLHQSPLPTAEQPLNTYQRKYRSRQGGNSMLGSPPRLGVVVRALVSLGQ